MPQEQIDLSPSAIRRTMALWANDEAMTITDFSRLVWMLNNQLPKLAVPTQEEAAVALAELRDAFANMANVA